MKYNLLLSGLFLLGSSLHAMKMNVVGNANLRIDTSCLEEGAGSDLKSELKTAPSCVQVFLRDIHENEQWELKFLADLQQLPANSRLYVRVNNPSTTSNDLDFVQSEWLPVSQVAQTLASGSQIQTPLEIQFKLNNLQLKNTQLPQFTVRMNFELKGK